jgi:hypothetical protein
MLVASDIDGRYMNIVCRSQAGQVPQKAKEAEFIFGDHVAREAFSTTE